MGKWCKWRKGFTGGRKRTARSQLMRKLNAANREDNAPASELDENFEMIQAIPAR